MSLHPSVAAVRNAVRPTLADAADPVLVACSGGADSLALLSAAIFEGHKLGLRVIGVTVDHGLQDGSAEHAVRVVGQMATLGVDETASARVTVEASGRGTEAAAREARYAVLSQMADHFGADTVLLGHTLDDQAETVLLGLARGSGGRSLAGMRRAFDRYRRPLLGISRTDTVTACQVEGIEFWDGPAQPATRRSRGSGCAPGCFRSWRTSSGRVSPRRWLAPPTSSARTPSSLTRWPRRRTTTCAPPGEWMRTGWPTDPWRSPTACSGSPRSRPAPPRPSCSACTCSGWPPCSVRSRARARSSSLAGSPPSGTGTSSPSGRPLWNPDAMDAADVPDDLVEVLFTEKQIQDRIAELAEQIEADYDNRDILLVGILRGAVMVMADMARSFSRHVEMDWMAISSYGSGTKSSGVVRILKDLDTDIIGPARDRRRRDHRHRPHAVVAHLQPRLARPGRVEICTLLRKPEALTMPST